MSDILVQFSPSRPDDVETAEVAAELLAAVRELGYSAAPDPEPIRGRGQRLDLDPRSTMGC